MTPADPNLAPLYTDDAVGTLRVEAVARELARRVPSTVVEASAGVETADVVAALEGADLAICTVDPGLAGLAYRLNRAALRCGVPWIPCSVNALEVVMGPTIGAPAGPCYTCVRARVAACAASPADVLAHESHLVTVGTDRSDTRENASYVAGIAGSLVATEVVRTLTGVLAPLTADRLLVVDLATMSSTRHSVLRRPRCGVCASRPPAGRAGSDDDLREQPCPLP